MRKRKSLPSGSDWGAAEWWSESGGAQDRQTQRARAVVIVEQLRRHVQAAAAAGAGAGAHGQLMDFAHTLFRRAADLVVGDSVTDAHVHFAARSIENDSHLAANENGCQ